MLRYRMFCRPTHLLLASLAAGCAATPAPPTSAPGAQKVISAKSDALYFASPKQAIPIIKSLLREKKWAMLSRYYDLSLSQTKRSELESGAFFVRQKRPKVAHPAGFWRYKHPFSPAFEYKGHTRLDQQVVVVEMGVEIDQGGGMVQRGRSYFKMRKSSAGWRLLPERGSPPPAPAL